MLEEKPVWRRWGVGIRNCGMEGGFADLFLLTRKDFQGLSSCKEGKNPPANAGDGDPLVWGDSTCQEAHMPMCPNY